MTTLNKALRIIVSCVIAIFAATPQLGRAASEASKQWAQKAYVAYYGRPADPGGLEYWAVRMDAEGGSLASIIGAFGDSDEFKRRYGGLTDAQLVTKIYQQTLGRDPDAGGLTWYVGELQAGRKTLQTITLDIMNGATTAPDATVVANRLIIANAYAEEVSRGCRYGREQDGAALLSAVSSESSTVASTIAAIGTWCKWGFRPSFAGEWVPVPASEIEVGDTGNVVDFHGLIRFDPNQEYGVVTAGWAFRGWNPATTVPHTVTMAVFAPNGADGLSLATPAYVVDAKTSGAGSIIVADFNGDGRDDILLLAHNESPLVATASTAYLSKADGTFAKSTLSDRVMAHDAELYYIDGAPTVVASTFQPGDHDQTYSFRNGAFQVSRPPNLGRLIGSSSIVGAFGPSGRLALVQGDQCINFHPETGYCESRNIAVYDFDGVDVTSNEPRQIIVPYLSTLPQYANYVSLMGPGATHVPRLWAEDMNQDGYPDLLAVTSMWHADKQDSPSALQVLINRKDGTFGDMTATLNPEMALTIEGLETTASRVDLDGSGINSYLASGGISTSGSDRHAAFLLLNDGTGRLYVALHDVFPQLAAEVALFLKGYYVERPDRWAPEYTDSPRVWKFIGVPQRDGTLNYLAYWATAGRIVSASSAELTHTVASMVNLPIHYNPKTAFIRNVTISDRNGSMRMRTWAGDDVIYDKNAAATARIDGGLGSNKCVYSGNYGNYTITKNSDGTYTVVTSGGSSYPALRDTLVNIQTLQFADRTLSLN